MTTATSLSKIDAAALRPAEVQLYLAGRGWKSEPYGTQGKGLLFHLPSIPEAELLLPLKRDLSDYAIRMEDLVVTLATVEQRPVIEVLNDLSGPKGDVFRLRVAGSVASMGNLPLDEAINLIEGGRRLLASAAQSLLRPEPLQPQRIFKPAETFLKSCRLGQTERGSFVATILAPVPPEIQHQLNLGDGDFLVEEQPFPRQVTTRLMSSLGMVSSAIESGEAKRLLDAVPQGVSANLCEALATMKPPGDESQLDIGVTWSRSRPQLPLDVPKLVSFPQEHFSFIEEVGRQLRTRATARRERYLGRIQSVKKAIHPMFLAQIAGWIIISTKVGGSSARIKLDLTADEFGAACDALRDDKQVAVTGIIRQDVKSREYLLTEPTGFEVLEG
jgi:hypothetical protein